MLRAFYSLSALILLAISFPIQAQETAADGEENLQPNAEIKSFINWNVQCLRNEQTGDNNCTLFQHLNVDSGQRLLTMQVNKLPPREGQTDSQAIVVTVPLGVHLPSGMRMQVDEGKPLELTYERCDQGGCYAGSILNESLLEALIAGKSNRVTFNNLRGEAITATLSLSGFTAGFRALEDG